MLERQIFKFQHGKRGIIVFGESVIMLLILGGMIFAIDPGYFVYVEEKIPYIPDTINHQSCVLETAKNMTPDLDIWHTCSFYRVFDCVSSNECCHRLN